MEPSTYAVCQAAKWLKSSVERLSGNSEYAPFWSPTSPRNGVEKRPLSTYCATQTVPTCSSGYFPDSLWKGYSQMLDFRVTAFYEVRWVPDGYVVCASSFGCAPRGMSTMTGMRRFEARRS
jgi:hypothetical protein